MFWRNHTTATPLPWDDSGVYLYDSTTNSPPRLYCCFRFSRRGCLKTKKKQTKQYAEDRDKRDEIAAERQVVGRKFDERDDEGNGTIEREQASD